ncbi:MAG TPA: Uma2 family endonuclease [Chloroflexota bacterium]
MIQTRWRRPPLTQEEADDLFMLTLDDDTEDAPWMVMGDLQFWSASGFAHSLRNYAHERGSPWFVASMLPIEYDWPDAPRKKVLSPDTFVVFAPEHARSSYDLEVEGDFPPFVLEVVSPSSTTRDLVAKRKAYALLGVREYALFTPRDGPPSSLEG